ncbi:hypothetical protein ACXR2T_09825 [Leucobacter sp. HY1910]
MTHTDPHHQAREAPVVEATDTAPLMGGTVTPTNFAAQNSTESERSARDRAFATLASLAESTARPRGDDLDTLGQLRLVELATEQARRAVIDDALQHGTTRQQIADTLAIDLETFEQRYGSKS